MKNEKKLDPNWIAWTVDTTVGAQLLMLNLREPAAAIALNNILIHMLRDLFVSEHNSIRSSSFVTEARGRLRELTNMFIARRTLTYLEEGMPVVPKILTPDMIKGYNGGLG